MLQGIWLNSPLPAQLSWVRVIWLAASFLPLILFGVMSLNGKHRKLNMLAGFIFLANLLDVSPGPQLRMDVSLLPQRVDVLARYILAIPEGLIAGVAMLQNASCKICKPRPALKCAAVVCGRFCFVRIDPGLCRALPMFRSLAIIFCSVHRDIWFSCPGHSGEHGPPHHNQSITSHKNHRRRSGSAVDLGKASSPGRPGACPAGNGRAWLSCAWSCSSTR